MADNPFVHVPEFIVFEQRFVAPFTDDQRVEWSVPRC
jgi:hypothetical protein